MNTATFFADATPAQAAPAQPVQAQSLRGCVEQAVENYFKHLDGQDVSNVYEMVLAEVEAPMLEIVLKYTRHNQTRAAQVLGLNRGTLRKKLKQYGLL
ncbi:Hin recombinational enhancer binding protein [Cellvibrio sp. BR]|jgi:Fis family transcriptional regulator|uniref:DNA-binding transcriptional regulator Fis n=1 Tax=unclassified Cellvibrio TaxID=2624793 RepID=UPI00026016B5|nr:MULTISPECIES: DNA-binding transcriptional regulator Fis [unclassified Cellvibrio]EIK44105.1 Hin recombinational enhancer binding protein [Cellvibrio sp. BR]QEY12458.1 DNA-binding transcriptional regulator Fis [Cellvibrio sp. KY-YJ-3]UUA72708.1 DNA-binding transcriptional regulator Fis [Cellvibrio sp. QJXJ]